MKVSVAWRKCQGDVWCSFAKLNLGSEAFNNAYGVYIIWMGTATIKIGSGVIRDEIIRARESLEFLSTNDLRITWCAIDPNNAPGVVHYLTNKLNPSEKSLISTIEEVEVNFPWI